MPDILALKSQDVQLYFWAIRNFEPSNYYCRYIRTQSTDNVVQKRCKDWKRPCALLRAKFCTVEIKDEEEEA